MFEKEKRFLKYHRGIDIFNGLCLRSFLICSQAAFSDVGL
ncbi:hypothetical protein HMPREF6123_0207 [Oribacterium sinus F0268]|uniref:Uncharacterized protein n=1 Tax=Oribacterium sinus F0268 TaxID=585501 RepID=C2KUN8_9FIRM|nr:hypothetical protein HMPREF6123_0207 [Oribacterium sinus F0268]